MSKNKDDKAKRLDYIEQCLKNISKGYALTNNQDIIRALNKYKFFIKIVADEKRIFDVDDITEEELLEYLYDLLEKWNNLTLDLGYTYIDYLYTDIYSGDKKTRQDNMNRRKQLSNKLKKVIQEIANFNIEILDNFGSFNSLFDQEKTKLKEYGIDINIKDIRSRILDMNPDNILTNLPGIISEILFYSNKIAKDIDALRLGSFIYSEDYYKFSESFIDKDYQNIIYNRFKIIENFYSLCKENEKRTLGNFNTDTFVRHLCEFSEYSSKNGNTMTLPDFLENMGLDECYSEFVNSSNYNNLQKRYNLEFNSQKDNKFIKDIAKIYNYSNAVSFIYVQKEWYILTLISQIINSNNTNKFNNRSTEYNMFGIYRDENDKLVFFAFIPNYNAPIMVHLNSDVIKDLSQTPLPNMINFYNTAPFESEGVQLYYPLTSEEINMRYKKIAKPARVESCSNSGREWSFLERCSDMFRAISRSGYCDFPKNNGTFRDYLDRISGVTHPEELE